MSVISATTMNRLESLYGNAYNKLNSALGESIDSLNTVKMYVNDAKVTIRAGIDREFGINSTNDFVAVPYATPTWSIGISNGTAYFGKSSHAIPTTIVNFPKTDKYGDALASNKSAVPFLISLVDGGSVAAATYRVYTNYQFTVNATIAGVTNYPIPSYTDNCVPLYGGYIGTMGITASSIQDVRNVVYNESLNDDVLILNTFGGLDTNENTILAKTFKEDFRAGVQAISDSTTGAQTLSFINYWKAQDYTFTDGFRKLYYDLYSADLYTKLVSVSPTQGGLTSTYANKLLNGVAQLSFKVESAANTISATTTVDVYGIVGTYSRLLDPLTAGSNVYIGIDKPANFTAYSYGAIANGDNAFDVVNISATTSGFTIVSHLNPANSVAHNVWDRVYPVELVRTWVPSGVAQNTVYDVGTTGSNYLGVGFVTVPTYGCATSRFLVYNK